MSNIKKTSILCLATKPRDQKTQGDPQRATSSKIIMNIRREVYYVFPQHIKYEKVERERRLVSCTLEVKWIKITQVSPTTTKNYICHKYIMFMIEIIALLRDKHSYRRGYFLYDLTFPHR
jgi:hypothetical protein